MINVLSSLQSPPFVTRRGINLTNGILIVLTNVWICSRGIQIFYNRFCPTVDVELVIHAADVGADRTDAQAEVIGYLFVGKTFGQQLQNLLFSGRELLN